MWRQSGSPTTCCASPPAALCATRTADWASRRWWGRRYFAALGVSVVLSLLCWSGWAADTKSSDEPITIRKTEQGLHFTVPPDWPIESRGGITAPIPIEEYLARKFKALESQLQAIEQRLNGLDVRLRVVEEEAKKQRQGLRSSEQTTATVGEP